MRMRGNREMAWLMFALVLLVLLLLTGQLMDLWTDLWQIIFAM